MSSILASHTKFVTSIEIPNSALTDLTVGEITDDAKVEQKHVKAPSAALISLFDQSVFVSLLNIYSQHTSSGSANFGDEKGRRDLFHLLSATIFRYCETTYQ